MNLESQSTARTLPAQLINIFHLRPDAIRTQPNCDVSDQDAVTERHVFLDGEDLPKP